MVHLHIGRVHRRVKKYASSAAERKLKPVQRPMRPPKEADGNAEKTQRRLHSMEICSNE